MLKRILLCCYEQGIFLLFITIYNIYYEHISNIPIKNYAKFVCLSTLVSQSCESDVDKSERLASHSSLTRTHVHTNILLLSCVIYWYRVKAEPFHSGNGI